jgi:hypothetical protein
VKLAQKSTPSKPKRVPPSFLALYIAMQAVIVAQQR